METIATAKLVRDWEPTWQVCHGKLLRRGAEGRSVCSITVLSINIIRILAVTIITATATFFSVISMIGITSIIIITMLIIVIINSLILSSVVQIIGYDVGIVAVAVSVKRL